MIWDGAAKPGSEKPYWKERGTDFLAKTHVHEPLAKAHDVSVLVLPACVVELEPHSVQCLATPLDLHLDSLVHDGDGVATVMREAVEKVVHVVRLAPVVLDAKCVLDAAVLDALYACAKCDKATQQQTIHRKRSEPKWGTTRITVGGEGPTLQPLRPDHPPTMHVDFRSTRGPSRQHAVSRASRQPHGRPAPRLHHGLPPWPFLFLPPRQDQCT
mmetsp:Transcript_10221/g.26191  ORF Transcript_10221/g.26191 Transcript_10221/m.26191 type:complete len:214 (-) Transcript_10221:231-872(-)